MSDENTPIFDEIEQPSAYKPTIEIGGVKRKLNALLKPRLACVLPTILGASKLVPESAYVDVDLLDDYPLGVNDQGDTMTCVAQALAKTQKSLWLEQGNSEVEFNPWFAYNLISPNNNGASIADALAEAQRVGTIPDDGSLPKRYLGRAMQNMYPELLRRAQDYRLEFGFQVPSWQEVVSAVQQRHRVIVGVPVFQSWMSVNARDPVIRNNGKFLGWHAIFICGYRAQEKKLKLLNSWNYSWGQNGTAWIGRDETREPFDGCSLESMLWTKQADPLLKAA